MVIATSHQINILLSLHAINQDVLKAIMLLASSHVVALKEFEIQYMMKFDVVMSAV